jgi:hypothetical protein
MKEISGPKKSSRIFYFKFLHVLEPRRPGPSLDLTGGKSKFGFASSSTDIIFLVFQKVLKLFVLKCAFSTSIKFRRFWIHAIYDEVRFLFFFITYRSKKILRNVNP